MNGVNTSQGRRLDAFHEQLTLGGGDRVWAHAPTMVDAPLVDAPLVDPSFVGAPLIGPPPPTASAPPTPPTVPRQGPTRAEARRAAKRRRAFVADPENLKLSRLVPRALVVAFLAGGTTAFVAHDKAVRLEVDGTPRTLHTFADDVTELLEQEGVTVGAHDRVSPGPGAGLDHGDEVVVQYGRPVTLTLDGVRHRVWTTADTVAGALREFGIRAEGAHLSAARSTRIARTGLTLTVRTERAVTFMADGQERTVRTNAATVREALAEAGITLHGQDTTSVAPASFPRDGQTISVMRITDTREVREETVPYAVERSEDPALFRGTEVIERAGRNGVRRVTYTVRTVNGVRQKPRRTAEELVHLPESRVVRTGTRQRPDSVAGADGLNWSGLAACESGGRADAVDLSGTYGGLYQFDTQTWQSLGGSGRPQDAPAAEQTYRAKKLYVQRGASPWPHCGRRLTG
ncbi:resuscitation-promoting factor [Streptomyces sp. CS131]|uniref:resuscitation-promoting factor n=1 Tax=Streptomyces sp. CS131 TaxID=2162711 RepID=UPI000D50660E|nr:resuscitation-promoting factor [Streptomyces sp. CS131]PVC85910.1 resuscitation-promoting factor [Streptomyces sp. CS131]